MRHTPHPLSPFTWLQLHPLHPGGNWEVGANVPGQSARKTRLQHTPAERSGEQLYSRLSSLAVTEAAVFSRDDDAKCLTALLLLLLEALTFDAD